MKRINSNTGVSVLINDKSAIKKISYDPCGILDSALFREIYLSTMMSHNNVIKVDNVSYSGGIISIRMPNKGKPVEKVEYSNLKDFVQQMIGVLVYMKENKIVHNDLKLSNILNSDSNSNSIYTVIDFGSAMIWEENTKYTPHSYTTSYAAPEILSKADIVNPFAIDIWSMGMCILEATLGTKLIKSEKVIPVFRSILQHFTMDDETLAVLNFNEIDVKKCNRGRAILPEFYPSTETNIKKIVELDSLKDLIVKMLMVDYRKRINIDDILKHPYLAKYIPQKIEKLKHNDIVKKYLLGHDDLYKITAHQSLEFLMKMIQTTS